MSRITILGRHRVATAIGLASVLAAGTAVTVAVKGSDSSQAATSSTAAAAAISCSTATGGKPFYDGPSASKVYDARFSNSAAVPNLGSYTPQGIGTWWNWDGSKDLLLVTAYRTGANSQIIGIDPATNKTVGVVAIAATHGGGITTSNGWAFVQGSTTGIRKYKLSSLKSAMKAAGTPYLKAVGTERKVYGASFLTSYGGYVWSGKFNDKGRDKMYQYKINSNGSLTTINKAWEVPTKTQGLLVTGSHFVFSTSYGRDKRSNLYVVRRGQPDLDKAKLSCFRAPSMSEGITEYGGRAYLVFESGSHVYRSDPKTLNVISRLHKATISSLTGLA
ncbi:hypothetical protein EV644_101330 [Kribbella orskensis]|uniref:WD40 repeat domain-containing protein n=1 Tax=Kribbella orskensis TaxID=2512216 RepID=A0ABY2BWG4_9ACTN|nr:MULTISPECIES: hypothetical protein [Kribbella]TCN44534.1 hypothetical protein EV642_101659 [Kribbella sp. VKM Ac-2500]TCO31688.1 hypothetical protein EV644_101330 [Kribbella orskensis]